ncbi:sushi domain-containing protein 3 isoform X2 [Puntigrus tetrazona]|uniref:sushi domain-containing protein 3 isoform X2 n=1 Tax=Puntigrus tetrazona TaxID=1606681 RepID=UPI001C8A87B8|nr:sushi domain-containing protein 3 isoform X2 [Puntigrus tetrazona]
MAFIGASEAGMGDWSRVHNHTGQCSPLPSPAVGTLRLVSGDGTSVGSVMSLQCPFRHRAVSGSQMSCVWSSNKTHWSGGTPECKPLSRFEDGGFRLALLLSFISLGIILIMSLIFITYCLLRHVKREERRNQERARKSGASEFWQQIDVEGVEMEREVQHSQKTTNHNNNNNSGRGERTCLYSHGERPCRCLHQGSIHPSQFSLTPADYLTNTHTGPVGGPGPAAGDRHVFRPLHDPLWTRAHLYSPRPPPGQTMSV